MKLSVLDQSPIRMGGTPRDAVLATIELAQLADKLGYTRYWLAEHHNTRTLASPTPEILIPALAAATTGIRVGSGGVMLSHYVRDSKLTNSEISGAGDTPVVLLGSADLMDGRAGTQPWHNEISHNYLHHFGAWGRQAAGYFEGLAGNNNVSFNVFHDGPRAVRTCWTLAQYIDRLH